MISAFMSILKIPWYIFSSGMNFFVPDNVVMPDAMEIIYQAALAAGKSGAVRIYPPLF